MSDEQQPQPRRDKQGVPWCTGPKCPAWKHRMSYSSCGHPTCVSVLRVDDVCEPQVRLDQAQARRDAEELARLRLGEAERLKLLAAASSKVDCLSASGDVLDAAGVEWQNEQGQVMGVSSRIALIVAERDRLRAENVRLVAIEQRAWHVLQRPRAVYGSAGISEGGEKIAARYILHGDAALGKQEK